ncbi:MAG: methyltransferase dimerization domain-containing protein, partial [Kiritimatiellia bacterium]|nr:methyltransferase dimerization domain-containing protein [Kiritimatiellia bacterium]
MTWTFARLTDLATGYWGSAALSAAVDLGVFEALAAREQAADSLAETLGASPRHLGELLQALVAIGLLEKTDGGYRIDASARPFLDPACETCLLGALRFNADLYPLWGRLADTVRRGAPALPSGAHLGMDPKQTRTFALGMNSRAMAMAPILLPALNLPR